MNKRINLKELVSLLNGTGFEVVRLSDTGRLGGKNYRLQVRRAANASQASALDVWAEYRIMDEIFVCRMFHWALEDAREAMAADDPRLTRIAELLQSPVAIPP